MTRQSSFKLATRMALKGSLLKSRLLPGHIKRLGAEKLCYVLARDTPVQPRGEVSDTKHATQSFPYYTNKQAIQAMGQALYVDITNLNGFSEQSLTSFTLILYHLRCFQVSSNTPMKRPYYLSTELQDNTKFPAYIKAREKSLPILKQILTNFKKMFPDSESPCIIIENEADSIESMNVLDFFNDLAGELDAVLLKEQLRIDLELPQSSVNASAPNVLTIPGQRLSHALRKYCTVLEWEKVHAKYNNATVLVTSGEINDMKTLQMATFCSDITRPILMMCGLPKERKEIDAKKLNDPSNPHHFNWLSLSALDLRQICHLYTHEVYYLEHSLSRGTLLEPAAVSNIIKRSDALPERCHLAAHLHELFQGKKVKTEDLEYYSRLHSSYFKSELEQFTEEDYIALESCVETVELTYRKHYTLVKLFTDICEQLDDFKKAHFQNFVDNVLRNQSVRLGVETRLPDHTIVSGDVTFRRTLISQKGLLYQHGAPQIQFTFMYMVKWKINSSSGISSTSNEYPIPPL